jgi:hypothetical protein
MAVNDMKRPARTRRGCRQCPFRAPTGQCLAPAIKSGRCGDWVWYVLRGKQRRRRYAFPKDPRTLAQLRSRAFLTAASMKYSLSLTDEQRRACIAAGAKVRCRPRLGPSGTLTGQQYLVRAQYAHARAVSKAKSAKKLQKPLQTLRILRLTWDPHRHLSGVSPGPHRQRQGRGGKDEGGRKKEERRAPATAQSTHRTIATQDGPPRRERRKVTAAAQVPRLHTFTRSTRGHRRRTARAIARRATRRSGRSAGVTRPG